MKKLILLLAVVICLLCGCNAYLTMGTNTYDFADDDCGFVAIFCDYHDDGNNYSSYKMDYEYKAIPVADTNYKGLYIKGNNTSDDLFMGYYKEMEGFAKNTTYNVKITFKLATDEFQTMGIGGSPTTSVFVKAGAFAVKPIKQEDNLGIWRFTNIDIGIQSQDGKDMKVVGNMARPDDVAGEGYAFKTMTLDTTVKTTDDGVIYLMIGTDSGFEGLTEYYLTDIKFEYSLVK